jgi:hypothetical protein
MEEKTPDQIIEKLASDLESQHIMEDLFSVYTNMYELSHRILNILKGYTPGRFSKVGLSNFLLLLLDKQTMNLHQIVEAVQKDFEHAVSRKSITDSLFYLKNSHKIIKKYDFKTKKTWYRKKTGI